MVDEQDMVEKEENQSVAQLDLLTSYLAFGGRALRKRRTLAAVVFVAVAGITILAVSIWPKTFHCESRLMAQRNDVLVPHGGGDPLQGASDVILRHDNLEAIVKQLELVQSWDTHRPRA